ncbi:MAG: hypothetical protein IAF94_02685, partial [Pirellulaceae bacterium]|nr:hypothetical protein [Pirellulaceae bacterium]
MAGLTQNRVEMLEPLAPRLVLKAGTQWFARLGHWAATAFIVTILLAAAGLKIHSSLAANA